MRSRRWEEKKINQWAQQLLKETLFPELSYELPGAAGSMPALPPNMAGGDATLKVRGRLRMHGRQRGVHNQHPPR